MLNSNSLANSIISAMNGADNATDAHSNFGNALKNYLMDTLELSGQYVGLLPNGSADPMNGTYSWKISLFNYSKNEVQQTAKNGLSGWIIGIKAQFNKIQFIGSDSTATITTSAPTTLLVANLNVDMSSKPDNMNDAMKKVAEGIVNGLKSGLGNPSTVPAMSTAGGQGAVTWIEVK